MISNRLFCGVRDTYNWAKHGLRLPHKEYVWSEPNTCLTTTCDTNLVLRLVSSLLLLVNSFEQLLTQDRHDT